MILKVPNRPLTRTKKLFDPACGTGGMLSVAEDYLRDLNPEISARLAESAKLPPCGGPTVRGWKKCNGRRIGR
jgi:hypothetical protein